MRVTYVNALIVVALWIWLVTCTAVRPPKTTFGRVRLTACVSVHAMTTLLMILRGPH